MLHAVAHRLDFKALPLNRSLPFYLQVVCTEHFLVQLLEVGFNCSLVLTLKDKTAMKCR